MLAGRDMTQARSAAKATVNKQTIYLMTTPYPAEDERSTTFPTGAISSCSEEIASRNDAHRTSTSHREVHSKKATV